MKMIHGADIHLGSAFSSRFPREKARQRKAELRRALVNMVEYAREQGISVILLSGDVFDSDCPSQKDKDFFCSLVRNNPDMDFLYLRGNHDRRGASCQPLPNLKTFSREWECYRYEDVTIWGLELDETNGQTLYSTLPARPEEKNIVMLHGQIGDSPGEGRICLPRLREKNIDYLALGHVHSQSMGRLDSRGIWCYPGCLEGRGYDETGAKGFVVLDTGDLGNPRFVSRPIRTIGYVQADLSGCEDLYQVCRRVEELLPDNREDLLRLELTGELSWDGGDLARELEDQLADRFFHVSVKDRTTRRIQLQAYEGEVSLAGEFLRQVQTLEGFSPEEKGQIMELGLRALEGREVAL